jgi:cell division septum initiation protein DivIVA
VSENDAHGLAGQIRAAIQSGRPVPMSSSAVVNRPAVLALVDKLEAALSSGTRDAERIVADAEEERDRMVSQTGVHSAAQQSADDLVSAARRESDELRREADAYVDMTFANLQVALTKTLDALERGRERLAGRSELDSLGHADDPDDATLPALPS